MIIVPRRSNERGNIDHGWLKTFHTFSFASYQNSGHESFGPLRAINENRVSAHTGFGVPSHTDFEVFSYIVSGELHREINISISESRSNDSLGTTRILKRGDVQLISAGAGVYHNEKAQNEDVHLLEIWSSRALTTVAPSHFIRWALDYGYHQYIYAATKLTNLLRHFRDEEKMNGWVRIAAPVNTNTPDVSADQDAPGSAPIQSAMMVYATMLASGVSRRRIFQLGSTKGYIHVIQTSGYNVGASKGAEIRLSGGDSGIAEVELREGDGAYIMLVSGSEVTIQNIGARVAEVLLFEME